MSPRRNHPRRRDADDESRLDRPGLTEDRVQQWQDGEWMVRNVFGQAGKTYRCPGCMQEIRPRVPHVVAWPTDGWGDESDRRHWHTGCWRARDRRAPVVERSRNAPRYG